jgi:hypothetical protein
MRSARPLLDLGGVGGDPAYQFQDVRGAVRLSRGQIVVGDRGAQELRWFDSLGVHLRTVGRRGEGPGEFSGLVSVYQREDSVMVFDERLQRLSVFDSEGIFVRSFQVPTNPGMVAGVFSDGSVLLSSVLKGESGFVEGYRRPVRGTVRLSSEGEVLNPLPDFPGREEVRMSIGSGGQRRAFGSMPSPFGKESVFAVFRDRFAVGTQDSEEISVLGLSGEPLSPIRWEGTGRAVTQEVIAERRAWELAQTRSPETRMQVEQVLRDEVYPDSLPAHGAIYYDEAGTLWVEAYHPFDQSEVVWQGFGRDGKPAGRFSLPGRFRVFRIGRDYVLGKRWDELDVEHVQLYGLTPSGG